MEIINVLLWFCDRMVNAIIQFVSLLKVKHCVVSSLLEKCCCKDVLEAQLQPELSNVAKFLA